MATPTARFDSPDCLNCGAALRAPYCGQCGQARARRFDLAALRGEAWQNLRLFEWDLVRAALRLVRAPGHVAREYVLGARRRHVHPLKLLLVAIGVLLLVQSHSAYFAAADERVSRALALALAYGRWSFSLGLLAIFAASWLWLRGRGGFNATEHLVLAVYAQCLVILAGAANLVPSFGAAVPAWHRAGSPWWMALVEGGIVAVAFAQFFALSPRRDGLRLAAATGFFLALKWLLQRAYAFALVRLVLDPATPGVSP